jgi:hypothetical protein
MDISGRRGEGVSGGTRAGAARESYIFFRALLKRTLMPAQIVNGRVNDAVTSIRPRSRRPSLSHTRRGTRKHTEAHGGTRRHTEAHEGTRRHTEAHGGTQTERERETHARNSRFDRVVNETWDESWIAASLSRNSCLANDQVRRKISRPSPAHPPTPPPANCFSRRKFQGPASVFSLARTTTATPTSSAPARQSGKRANNNGPTRSNSIGNSHFCPDYY